MFFPLQANFTLKLKKKVGNDFCSEGQEQFVRRESQEFIEQFHGYCSPSRK
jgi:hypothetical protein